MTSHASSALRALLAWKPARFTIEIDGSLISYYDGFFYYPTQVLARMVLAAGDGLPEARRVGPVDQQHLEPVAHADRLGLLDRDPAELDVPAGARPAIR